MGSGVWGAFGGDLASVMETVRSSRHQAFPDREEVP